jgi:uncharacterized protein YjhX (UPF0386 family)
LFVRDDNNKKNFKSMSKKLEYKIEIEQEMIDLWLHKGLSKLLVYREIKNKYNLDSRQIKPYWDTIMTELANYRNDVLETCLDIIVMKLDEKIRKDCEFWVFRDAATMLLKIKELTKDSKSSESSVTIVDQF